MNETYVNIHEAMMELGNKVHENTEKHPHPVEIPVDTHDIYMNTTHRRY